MAAATSRAQQPAPPQQPAQQPMQTLPDSPGATTQSAATPIRPCPTQSNSNPEAASASTARNPCGPTDPRYARFLNSTELQPLTSRQKGRLAIRDLTDPFNIVTILLNSGITVAVNSHTAYGPGMRGFGRFAGYSFVQDATGEFIGTYAVCSLVHEDPRYHRDPHAPFFHRVIHAVSHTVISQHDDGRKMPNIENMITFPASAEISNLYVPGVAGNGPSTVKRILYGLASDPINQIVTEFLPDFARRIHIRIVFVQQILNQVAANP